MCFSTNSSASTRARARTRTSARTKRSSLCECGEGGLALFFAFLVKKDLLVSFVEWVLWR